MGGPQAHGKLRTRSMHYERAPRFRRWKLDVAPPPLRCAVQGLRSATAALGEGTRVVCPAKKTAAGPRQIGWRMALYLGGKASVSTNDLSPKEATQMSHDVKYIGMDVHKEAIVIAVLNGLSLIHI